MTLSKKLPCLLLSVSNNKLIKFQIYYSLFLFSLDSIESHAIVLFLVLLNQNSLKSKSVRKSVRNRMNLETMSWMKNTSHKMASNGQEC